MKNDEIMNNIINIFYTHKERYGYRRIALELRNKGYIVNHKKVKRLMSSTSIYLGPVKQRNVSKITTVLINTDNRCNLY